jgi:hypothetical protein
MPQPYKPPRRETLAASTHLWPDCADAVRAYATAQNLSLSGAIHKLLRTHPLINLPDLQ